MSDLTPVDEFDQITSGVTRVSPFQALWNEAEELLIETRPEGFFAEDIGRIAFDTLPEVEKAGALEELFYTFWSATMADRETRATQTGGAS